MENNHNIVFTSVFCNEFLFEIVAEGNTPQFWNVIRCIRLQTSFGMSFL